MRILRFPVTVLILVAAAALFGCMSGKMLHDRHRMSRVYIPGSGNDIIFEASTNPDYPADSEAGEAVRREWMAQWLDQRNLCPEGFEVTDRQPIGSAADNPYWHNLRYVLRCKP